LQLQLDRKGAAAVPTHQDTRRRVAQARVTLANDDQLVAAVATTFAEKVVRTAAARHLLSDRRAA
jgi:hypothetical protein